MKTSDSSERPEDRLFSPLYPDLRAPSASLADLGRPLQEWEVLYLRCEDVEEVLWEAGARPGKDYQYLDVLRAAIEHQRTLDGRS